MGEAGAALLAVLAAPASGPVPPLPATLVVTAHPDDETVGAGSRLPRLAQALFLWVTDGAPRTGEDASRHGYTPAQYAQARRGELAAVAALCGIETSRFRFLDCPDQQASLQLAALSRRVANLLAAERIAAVLTQPYEGGHPDHDATAFVVHAACALLRTRGVAAPDIVEMASYHRDADGQRHCGFLPAPMGQDARETMIALDAEEQRRKAHLIGCFTTQRQTLSGFPVDCEGYRPAPRYDFRQPPHAGQLHYEHYPWGMTGARFRQLAAEALAELRLEGAP